jgi:DNA-binding MarR family transcriptional regulator
MGSKLSQDEDARARRRLGTSIKDSLRALTVELSLLNHNVGGHLGLRDVDLDCLDLIDRHGPLSPSALARLAALHPATMTGILDRLERGDWISRDRDPADRRAVLVSSRRDRGAEVYAQYATMNASMDELIAGYDAGQLTAILDFLQRTVANGKAANERFGDPT